MTQVHEVFNTSQYPGALAFAQDAKGHDVAVVLIKVTSCFDDTGTQRPASPKQAVPIFLHDVFYASPESSSLRHASDVAWTKPGTDIAINGHAYGRGRPIVDARLSVAALTKTVRVFGARTLLQRGEQSRLVGPEPFERIPLRYEHTYGGSCTSAKGERVAYELNPVGVGYAPPTRDKVTVPNLEHPARPWRGLGVHLEPVSLGFVPPGWQTRARFAGTFDDAWFKQVRPLFPQDFDERFANAVPQDQVLPEKLKGGEHVILQNVSPTAPTVSLIMPALSFRAVVRIKGVATEIPMVVDSLLIEPDLGRFALTYRGSHMMREDIRYLETVVFRQA